jgi:mercuric ion transport protein
MSMSGGTPNRRLAWVSLFASSSTLLCCALPMLLVAFGFGAASASLFATLPFLLTMVEYKAWMFVGSGLLMVAAAALLYLGKGSCPADPELARQCNLVRRWNTRALLVASAVWIVGFSAAYLALPVYLWLTR